MDFYHKEGKNIHIELLKFIAIFLILNGHMSEMYPPSLSLFATGGTIGDALFFFCSGYTLFLGRMDRFDNWYARRIRRIYPSVIAWAILSCALFGAEYNIIDILMRGTNRWFISCIMIYYVLLYLIRKYVSDIKGPIILSVLIPLCYYFTLDSSSFFMYRGGFFRYTYWFVFMLMGAYIGSGKLNFNFKKKSKFDILILLVCIVLHYGLSFSATKSTIMAHMQIVSLIPLMGGVIYLYKISEILYSHLSHNVTKYMCLISGLCLETYLVQYSFFTDNWNSLFPLNLLMVIIIILITAYVTRSLGRVFTQIFSGDNIDWNKVFTI